MRVRCIARQPTTEQIEALGPEYYQDRDYLLSVGTEYTVFGMAFEVRAPASGTGTWLNYLGDDGHLAWAPVCLFAITDGRMSRHWVAHAWENGSVTMGPPSFYRPSYHDQLAEGVPEIVADFDRVCSLVESEYDLSADAIAVGSANGS